MCGILGIIANDASDYISSLSKTMSHRGPDDSGIYIDGVLALAHTRLSILDLSENGHQPMISADGQYVIIYNGEIYNHNDIRKNLTTKYSFKSTSDTETILYGFIEYGKDVLNMLNGIFAFAIYDKKNQKIFIARDQFGVKPLYYYQDEKSFLFGSELKSFIQFPTFEKDLNYKALFNYITFLYSPGEITPFQKVKKLLPGHYLQINIKEHPLIAPVKYYDIPFSGNYSSDTEQELVNKLEQKLLAAVERQMLSDVPVGFFLSGGLDSSALVAMARKIYPDRDLQCFTIETQNLQESEGISDDLYYARIVAKHLNVKLEVVKAEIDIVNDFDKMVYHLDEPQADVAPLNVLKISERAKQMGYKVLIGGTAGDDLFSGYKRHQALAYENYFKVIPVFAGKLIKIISNCLNSKNPRARRIKKIFANLDQKKYERLKGYYYWLAPNTVKSLFDEKIKTQIKSYDPGHLFDLLIKSIPEEKSDLNKMLYWELKTFLVDHNLNYTDKLSMAEGIEVRVPFLDKELVEFSATIPPWLKMKGTTTKYILKKVMEKYLPKEIIYRPKSGFGAPLRKWITQDLDFKIKQYLSPEVINARGIFNSEKIYQLIDDNKKGKIDASYSIWALLAIESWLRQFVDKRQ